MAGVRQSLALNLEQIDTLKARFDTFDDNNDGFISHDELREAFQELGMDIPNYKVRDLIAKCDDSKDGKINFTEFQKLYGEILPTHSHGRAFLKAVKKREGVNVLQGSSEASAEGTTHSVAKEEETAFINWINRNLEGDADCRKYLPIDDTTGELYKKCSDGILLCKMINKSCPDTIDERALNKGAKLSTFQVTENLTLAINSARAIGCNVVNIGPEDLKEGKPHLVLGLLWQVIRIGLLSDINLHENPNLAVLLEEGETIEDLMKLSPEQLLIRWVNYHLRRANGCNRQIQNFSGDVKDSEAYTYLLHQIAPKDAGVSLVPLHVDDPRSRAEAMLQEADKIECRSFVSPDDVVSGNPKLNLAFVANLYNMYPALEDVEVEEEIIAETREEKTYRNWMNSMGVSPYVNRIYVDLGDGIVIFQLYDIIKPGIVDWKRVHKKFNKMRMMMEKVENDNYAVELGKQCKFSLVGIDGKDLYDGNQTLTLALVWQLMRGYTLSILSKLTPDGHPIVDKEIIAWVNETLKVAGKKTQVTGFADPSISNGVVVLDLVDAIKPGSVNYDLVKPGPSEENKLDNAKLAISMARKIGARVYALPEDIVEVKPKMVLTVFACLMIKGYQPPQQQIQQQSSQ